MKNGMRSGSPDAPLLLADDSDVNRVITRRFLASQGLTVDEAQDGRQAVELFKHRRYGLVLVDVRMPVLDGLAAAREMRAWERDQRREPTPILAVTAGGDAQDREAALAAGCQAILRRPVGPGALSAAVELFCARDNAWEGMPLQDLLAEPETPAQVAHLLPRLFLRLGEERRAMAACLDAGDLAQLAEQAHKGRGECSVFGLAPLESQLTMIEEAARDGRTTELRMLLAGYRALLRWHGDRHADNVCHEPGEL